MAVLLAASGLWLADGIAYDVAALWHRWNSARDAITGVLPGNQIVIIQGIGLDAQTGADMVRP